MQKKRPFPTVLIVSVLLVILVSYWQYRVFRIPSRSDQKTTAESITSEFVSAGVEKDGVPVIDHPKFENVNNADTYLNNDGIGIAFSQNGSWRFYPYQILVWHHAINDTVGDVPVLVSYSPLAFSGSVFSRSFNGITLDFGSSDKMYNTDLLLYDRKTNSMWDVMMRQAISGDMKGMMLVPLVSTVMSWNDFKTAHSGGMVLSRDTGFVRDYTHDPYEDYYSNEDILFPVAVKDARLSSKELIYGIETSNGVKAYTVKELEKSSTIADSIGSQKISIVDDPATHVVHAFSLNADDSRSAELPITQAYWFAWAAAHPKTDLYSVK